MNRSYHYACLDDFYTLSLTEDFDVPLWDKYDQNGDQGLTLPESSYYKRETHANKLN